MTKKKVWFVFGMVVFVLILGVLACSFPAVYKIEGGLLPSSFKEGKDAYATLNTDLGCDCAGNRVSGQLWYEDYKKDKAVVAFTGIIDQIQEPNCEISEDTLWTGTYTPDCKQGVFYIGQFGPDHENYDEVNCAGCESCWRLWLVDGKFDGYENWACDLNNAGEPGIVTIEDHPEGSDCRNTEDTP